MLDSLQLVPLAGAAGPAWIDLGSGAGFPGLVVAIARPGTAMRLVEANRKKAAFLIQAAAAAGAPVEVVPHRIETVTPTAADVVSARALAPLPKLFALAERFFSVGTLGLFMKGGEAAAEVEAARRTHRFELDSVASETEPGATVLMVRSLESRAPC